MSRYRVSTLCLNFLIPCVAGFVGTTAIGGALTLAIIGGMCLVTLLYVDTKIAEQALKQP